MIFNYRCYPTPSRIPTLVPSFATHDIPAVSLFFVAFGALGAGEAVVVGTNSVAMGPTVSILDPSGAIGAIIWPDGFALERVDFFR